MDKVSELFPKDGHQVVELLQARRQSQQRSQASPERLRETLSELVRMKLLAGVTVEMAKTWTEGLADMSELDLKRGLHNAKDFKGQWFSLPIFRDLCRDSPERLGLPDVRKAFLEAANSPPRKDAHPWSHPIVYHAGRETGWFELQNLAEAQSFPRFKNAYEQLVNRVLNGESLDLPVRQALQHNPPRFLSKAENRARLAQLMAEVGL